MSGKAICYSFQESGSCRFGDNCRFSHDTSSADDSSRPPRRERRSFNPTPRRRFNRQDFKSQICRNMKNDGECKFGDACRYSHDMTLEESTAPPHQQSRSSPQQRQDKDDTCYTFRDEGSCKFGDECRFRHGPNDRRDLKLLKRRANGVCYNWRDNGSCKFEDNCRFAHEHLTETTAASA